MRFPCSYMIYSEPFNELPPQLKDAIYRRMGRILSGEEKSAKYARLSSADRRAVIANLARYEEGPAGLLWRGAAIISRRLLARGGVAIEYSERVGSARQFGR